MSKGGGKVDTSNLENIMRQQVKLANEEFQYGMGRTQKYTDPVLNDFLKILGFGGGTTAPTPVTATGGAQGLSTTSTAPFTDILSSSMMQLPVWSSQQSLDAAKKQITENMPPGPQQSAALADLENKRMQNLGTQAYGMVGNMINSLTGQGQAWVQGGQLAQSSLFSAGQIASTITSLQTQAQQQNNLALSGIFGAIGSLGGFAIGTALGGPAGGMLGGAVGGTAGQAIGKSL